MEWYHVWWHWLTYKRVTQVCQHQLIFLLHLYSLFYYRGSDIYQTTEIFFLNAILSFRNLLFRSCGQRLCVILLLRAKRTINCWDVAKNDFQYDDSLPSWMCKIFIFLSRGNFSIQNAHLHTQFHYNRTPAAEIWRETIFKMAVVRNLEFSKIAI